ncbi:MAG: hypothetical protein WC538_19810 [Thermoanaerobaculia bacterium]|jgi:hypothetical protein
MRKYYSLLGGVLVLVGIVLWWVTVAYRKQFTYDGPSHLVKIALKTAAFAAWTGGGLLIARRRRVVDEDLSPSEFAEVYYGSEPRSAEAALRVRSFLEQHLIRPLPRLHPFMNLERDLGFPLSRVSTHEAEVFSASLGVRLGGGRLASVSTVEDLIELVAEDIQASGGGGHA